MAKNSALHQPNTAFDLLQIPVIGRVLKGRYGRFVLQLPFLIIAVLLIYDGFTGPQTASRNLATVVPWVHYRGIVVLAILLVGNLFCMGCPFTVPRTLARRVSSGGRRFPRFLRNKWVAILSLFGLFFVYEWLDLWSSPALTAWLIVAYFVASFLLEAIFNESPFCKYVCPLGIFNWVYSTASPTQIGVKDRNVCASCVGKECVNGSYATEAVIRIDEIPFIDADGTLHYKKVNVEHSPKGTLGCGTELFPPQIKSNLDCIYCLDCVRACPHDNIGLLARLPGRELLNPEAWPKRWDVSLLVIALAFMAVTNAFGMVPPVFRLQEQIVNMGIRQEWLVLFIIFGVGNLLLPLVSAVGAAWLGRLLTANPTSLRDTIAAFAPAFVPLGLGIWIAHYAFHFLIAPFLLIPIVQEFLGQTGDWARYGVVLDNQWIGLIQVMALAGGFLWSMVIAQQAALRIYKRQSVGGLLPWALLLLLLMMAALQIFGLPMEMRGTEDIFAAIGQTIM